MSVSLGPSWSLFAGALPTCIIIKCNFRALSRQFFAPLSNDFFCQRQFCSELCTCVTRSRHTPRVQLLMFWPNICQKVQHTKIGLAKQGMGERWGRVGSSWRQAARQAGKSCKNFSASPRRRTLVVFLASLSTCSCITCGYSEGIDSHEAAGVWGVCGVYGLFSCPVVVVVARDLKVDRKWSSHRLLHALQRVKSAQS